MNPPYFLRRAAAPVLQFMHPSWGFCHRCQLPWCNTDGHTTMYSDGRGCFPLCEQCWQELRTPEKRLPYYEKLISEWEQSGRDGGYEAVTEDGKSAIREAVAAGR